MKKRIGFFGGCFNPVTKAHINLIKNVIQTEKIDKVYFVPMGDLYQKRDMISAKHRIEMLKLALKAEGKLDILDISNNNCKMCAIDTFQIIDKQFSDCERFFIMGSDNYKKITNWKKSEDLIQNYKYIILDRENGNTKEISSSMVRKKIKLGENIENLVPIQVINYINENNLYK